MLELTEADSDRKKSQIQFLNDWNKFVSFSWSSNYLPSCAVPFSPMLFVIVLTTKPGDPCRQAFTLVRHLT